MKSSSCRPHQKSGLEYFKFCYKHTDFYIDIPRGISIITELILGDKGRKLQKRKLLHFWYFTGISINIKSIDASLQVAISGVQTDFEIILWPDFGEKHILHC